MPRIGFPNCLRPTSVVYPENTFHRISLSRSENDLAVRQPLLESTPTKIMRSILQQGMKHCLHGRSLSYFIKKVTLNSTEARVKSAIEKVITQSNASHAYTELQEIFESQDAKSLCSENILDIFLKDKGKNFCLDEGTIEKLSPYLRLLTSSDFARLIKFSNASGRYLFHNAYTLQVLLATPLIQEKLSESDLLYFMQVKDTFGRTPLHIPGIYKIMRPLFESFSSQGILELLTILIQFKSGEKILLVLYLTSSEFLSLFSKLSPEHMFEVMQLKNCDGSTLLNTNGIPALVMTPMISCLTEQQLFEILKIRNEQSQIPLMCQEVIVHLPLIFQFLTAEHVYALLQIQDQEGNTLLHYPNVLDYFLDIFLKKLPPEHLIHLLGIVNINKKSPLDQMSVLKTLPLFYRRLSKENRLRLLKIYVNESRKTTVLHSLIYWLELEVLKEMHLWEGFSSSEKMDLLSQQDTRSSTPIHYAYQQDPTFSLFMPIFQELPRDQLYSLMILKDFRDFIFLFCPESSFEVYKNLRPLLSDEQWLDLFRMHGKGDKCLFERGYLKYFDEIFQHTLLYSKHENGEPFWLVCWKRDPLIFVPRLEECQQTKLLKVFYDYLEVRNLLEIFLSLINPSKMWLGMPKSLKMSTFHNSSQKEGGENAQQLDIKTKVLIQESKKVLQASSKNKRTGLEAYGNNSYENSRYIELKHELENQTVLLLQDMVEQVLSTRKAQLPVSDHSLLKHDEQQLKYAAGLSETADPLSKLTLEEARKLILEKWRSDKIVFDFWQILLKMKDKELEKWLSEHMPESFQGCTNAKGSGVDADGKENSSTTYEERRRQDFVKTFLMENGKIGPVGAIFILRKLEVLHF